MLFSNRWLRFFTPVLLLIGSLGLYLGFVRPHAARDEKNVQRLAGRIQEKLEGILKDHKAPALTDNILAAIKAIREKGVAELEKKQHLFGDRLFWPSFF